LAERGNFLVDRARYYLENRPGCRIDPDRTAKEYGLSVCVCGNPEISYGRELAGRIICPCWTDGKMVGWQARSTLLNPAEETGIAAVRYLSMQGTWRPSALFGVDQAAASSFVVLVEGPLDVVQAGPPCVCPMGMAASMSQLEIVARRWGGPGKAIVMCFDGEDAAHAVQDQAAATLKRMAQGSRVFSPKLPNGDPGSWPRAEFWKFVKDRVLSGSCEVTEEAAGATRAAFSPSFAVERRRTL
jgi:hypothetical protein